MKALCTGLSVENVCEYLVLGEMLNSTNLKDAAFIFTALNFNDVKMVRLIFYLIEKKFNLKTDSWAKLPDEYTSLALMAEKQGTELAQFVGKWKYSETTGDWRGYGSQFGHVGFSTPLIHSIGRIMIYTYFTLS